MRSKAKAGIFGIMTAACLLSISGCSGDNSAARSNIALNQTGSSSDGSSVSENDYSDSGAPTTPPVRNGAPTIFIGPDGEPVCDGDVTKLIHYNYNEENFSKTPAEVTAEDEGTLIICEGFQYFKEPAGKAYNSYDNPELFEGSEFKGEMPENNSPWKRVDVGGEICGLKLKYAVSQFMIGYGAENDFKERGTYYNCTDPDAYQYSGNNCLAEFEGSLTLTGFLSSSPRSYYFPDGGFMDFIPIEDKLPVVCYDEFKTKPNPYFARGTNALCSVGENSIMINIKKDSDVKNQQEIEFADEKPGIGDTVLARVTISNITYGYGYYHADFSDVEILSDVLAHEDDSI